MAQRPAESVSDSRPVGIFDSGVGGLSVWREIARHLPDESTIYVADQAHLPYGPRPAAELFRFAEGITRYLIEQHACKAIVVACNSASAAALKHLRAQFPRMRFVGMEPAIKPAAERTRSRVVAVLATPATLQGELFTATTEKYAQGIRIIGEPCPGLVRQIEADHAHTPETEQMLRGFLQPAIDAGADEVVLACTHYPFVIDVIRRIVGPHVEVIDPAPAVGRQLGRVLDQGELRNTIGAEATHLLFTTGPSVYGFARTAHDLAGAPARALHLRWFEDTRLLPDHIPDRSHPA
jgi:glutamate racemase